MNFNVTKARTALGGLKSAQPFSAFVAAGLEAFVDAKFLKFSFHGARL